MRGQPQPLPTLLLEQISPICAKSIVSIGDEIITIIIGDETHPDMAQTRPLL